MDHTPLRRRALQQAQQSNPTSPRTFASASTETGPNGGLTPPFSLSASTPFDWEAARGEKPAPYRTYNSPSSQAAKKKSRLSTTTDAPRARVVRKESWLSRLRNYPSHLWFEITLLPQKAPLPEPRVLGRALGVLCHVISGLERWVATRGKADLDNFGDDWSDMRTEMGGIPIPGALEDEPSWSVLWLCGWLLLLASIGHALWIFMTFRTYTFFSRKKENPVNSPNAKFVRRDSDRQHDKPPLIQQIFAFLGRVIKASWRLLIGSSYSAEDANGEFDSVLQLRVWSPGDLELALLTVYSPVHALMYTIASTQNWIRWTVIMLSLSVMLHFIISWYEQLVKDTRTVASEVMSEYNEGFVYPRINVVRKDACVMTHEAEIIDFTPPRQYVENRHDVASQPRSSAFIQPKTYQQMQLERQHQLSDNSPRAAKSRHSVAGITAGGLLRF